MMKLPALKEIIEERKEKAIEDLSDSFAKNKLPLEEYERLAEYINKIESERELMIVEKIVREYGTGYGESGTSPVNYNDENEADNYHDDYNNRDNYFQSGSNLTVLSTRTFSGPLKSGTQFVSILGSGHIKIRKSDLDRRQTVLNVVSILGDTVISVESGIRVSNRVIPVLGNADTNHKVYEYARQDEAELIVSGTALLGNITVKLLK